MKQADIDAMMRATANVVRSFVEQSITPVVDRISALEPTRDAIATVALRVGEVEKRQPVHGEKGDPGQNGKDGSPGRDGIDGKDGEPGQPGEKGEQGPPGLNGKDGADGRDGKDGIDGINGKDGAPGADGLSGKDGRDGIDGKSGADGRDGQPGAPGTPGRDGKDGEKGADGKDGRHIIKIEKIDTPENYGQRIFYSDESSEEFKWEKPRATIDLLAEAYKKVWRDGQEYGRGSLVTFGGSMFLATRDTINEKPETSDAWVLCIKRGRDGKDGKNGTPGQRGEKGEKGDIGPRGFAS